MPDTSSGTVKGGTPSAGLSPAGGRGPVTMERGHKHMNETKGTKVLKQPTFIYRRNGVNRLPLQSRPEGVNSI